MNNFREFNVSELSRENLVAISGGIGDGYEFTMPTDPDVRKGMHEGLKETAEKTWEIFIELYGLYKLFK